jgi:HD-like signal output (HDOD) protein
MERSAPNVFVPSSFCMGIHESPLRMQRRRRREQFLHAAQSGALGARHLAQRLGHHEQGLRVIYESFEAFGQLQLGSAEHFGNGC